MAERSIFVRLALKDAEKTAAALRAFGKDGEQALRRLEQSTAGPSRGLLALDAASGKGQKALQQLASSAALVQGPLGNVSGRLSAFGAVLGRVNPVVAAGVIATAGLAAGLHSLVAAGSEAERSQFRIGQLLKQTGFASGFTADQLDKMAVALGKATLTSRNEARQAVAELLTFRSVSGSAFEQALKLSQDLAATGIGTLTSNVLQLGKALEDPVRGLDSLRRSGVSFTQAQRDAIKAMVEAGDVAEAQRIILQTLEGQVGGAGEGEAKGLTGAWDTLVESLGVYLEKANESLGITDKLAKAVNALREGVESSTAADFPDPASRLRALQAQMGELEQAGGPRGIRPGGPGPASHIEALRAEAAVLRDQLVLQEESEARARSKAALAKREAAAEAEAAKQREAAEKAAQEAAKQHDRERKAALSDLARAEEEVATAGLKGIALLEARRDQELAKFQKDLDQKLINEAEFNRARLALETTFQREKAQIESEAAERARQQAEREAEREQEKRDREAERAAERQAELLAEPFKEAARDIQGTFKGLFEQIFETGRLSLNDLAGAFRSTFASLASSVLTQQLFTGQSAATVPGGVGLAAGGLGFTGAGGGTGTLVTGGLLGSVLAGGPGGISLFASNPVLQPGPHAFVSEGIPLSGLLTAVALGGGAGSLFAPLLGLNQTGGGIGGGLGAGAGFALGSLGLLGTSIGGPLGGLIGGGLGTLAGGLIGNVFGGGGNNRGGFALDLITGQLAKVGRSGSKANFQAAQAIAQQIGQGLAALQDIGLAGLEIERLVARVGDESGAQVLLKAGGQTLQSIKAKSPDALAAAALQALGAQGTGLPDIVASALAKSTATTTAGLLSDVQFAQAIDALIHPANELEKALADLKKQFDQARERADLLGLSVEDVDKAFGEAKDQILDQFLGPLKAFRDQLAVSEFAPGAPVDKFKLVESQFETLRQQALGGDLAAIQAVPQGSTALLQAARSLFASGPQFQSLLNEVEDLVGRLIDATGFQHGGSGIIGGSGGPDSQLFVARATPGEAFSFTPPGRRGATDRLLRQIGAVLTEIKAELRASRASRSAEAAENQQRLARLERELRGLGGQLEKRVKAA